MIKQLTIKNIRGVKRLNIDVDKKPMLVFGENGKGKSSIIDAIEWALTGKISHLSESGLNVSIEKHAHHISSTSKQKEVLIKFDDDSVLSTQVTPEKNTKAEMFRSKSGQGLNILRRSQLLLAICAKPKDRYELLKPFLPLNKISDIEYTAQKVIEKIDLEMMALTTKIREQAMQISIRLELDTNAEIKGKQILEAISKMCNTLSIKQPTSLDDLKELKDTLLDEVSANSDKAIIMKYQNILLHLKQLKELQPVHAQHEQLKRSFEEYKKVSSNKDKLFNDVVLKLGQKWISDGNLKQCPLCLNEIDYQKVVREINERLENEGVYITCKKSYLDSVGNIKQLLKSWVEFCTQLSGLVKDLKDDGVVNFISLVEATSAGMTDNSIMKTPESTDTFDIIEWNAEIDKALIRLISKYESLVKSIDNPEKIVTLTKLLEAVKCIENHLPQINIDSKKFLNLKKARECAFQWKDTLEKRRKLEVQTIYDSIKDLINDLYGKIHPRDTRSELVGGINLAVRETGGGSALLQASFHEKKNEDPRSYYSESHLDTLGLCIFLALYKKEAENNKYMRVLVLDDVLTSVDSPHRKRVAELLLAEFKGHQIIITTHDIVWFNDIIDLQKKHGVSFKNLTINDWDIENGPMILGAKTYLDELKFQISMGADKSIIAGCSGRFLEMILNKLRYSLRMAIEAKNDDKYTIGDIWPSFRSKIKSSKEKFLIGFYESNRSIVEDIPLFLSIRNDNGCHYNEWAEGRSSDEVKDFANAIIDFYNSVYCSNCGDYVAKITVRNKDEFYCRCKNISYLPSISLA